MAHFGDYDSRLGDGMGRAIEYLLPVLMDRTLTASGHNSRMSDRWKGVLERRNPLHIEFTVRSPLAPTLLATRIFPGEKFAVEHYTDKWPSR